MSGTPAFGADDLGRRPHRPCAWEGAVGAPGGVPGRASACPGVPLATRRVSRRVIRQMLTPDDVGTALAAAGWVAVDAFRWRDEGGAVLGWPLAMAAVERRARSLRAPTTQGSARPMAMATTATMAMANRGDDR